jgi:hypothetical protein
MTDEQYNYKQHTSNHLLGAGLALGLLIDGVKANIEPEYIDLEQEIELNTIYAVLSDAAARLVSIAMEVKQR